MEQKILVSKRQANSAAEASTSYGSPRGSACASGSLGVSTEPLPTAGGCADLVLSERIGAGGFGAVWKGSWKKVTAAIKVGRAAGGRAGRRSSAFRRGAALFRRVYLADSPYERFALSVGAGKLPACITRQQPFF
jgi:hypothetical protein